MLIKFVHHVLFFEFEEDESEVILHTIILLSFPDYNYFLFTPLIQLFDSIS